MNVDPSKYKAVQLQEWLRSLGLIVTGKKCVLAARLNALEPDVRGIGPQPAYENASDSESEYETDADQGIDDRNASILELNRREIAMLKREKELLERENLFLKQLSESTSSRGGAPLEQPQLGVPISMLKELVPGFDGESNFKFWATQIKNLRSTYGIGEELLRGFVASKLSGSALKWLHANIDFAVNSVDQVLAQMEEVFGTKESKLVSRRKFESRNWKFGECFNDYLKDKWMLASAVNIEEEEIVDYAIDGIPDEQLRTQAHLQCFTSKAQLLKAFARVTLKQRPRQNAVELPRKEKKDVRCYNCSSLGHYSSECSQPKREYGACYGCGSKDHRVNVCPRRKIGVVYAEDENEYVRKFKFTFDSNPDCSCYLEALIDSGSPISFVKKSIVANLENLNFIPTGMNDPVFFGLNKSQLISFGKIACCLLLNNFHVNLNLLIVADESMGIDVVLGRDFLRKSSSKIILGKSRQNNDNYCDRNEILRNCKVGLPDCGDIPSTNIFCKEESLSQNACKRDLVIVNAEVVKKSEILAEDCEDNIMNVDVIVEDEPCLIMDDNCDYLTKKRVHDLFMEHYWLVQKPDLPENRCEMRIVLSSDKPFNCCPRRISYTERVELQELLDEYLGKNYIRPSNSEYASAIVLVKKKTGGLRLCIDFRNLNKITVKDNYPIPIIDDLLDKLAGKTIFTKLDLKDGFFHVFMHPDSIKFTSFVTPLGQFEFLRMPFGLKNAPSMFQRFVHTVFADMIRNEEVIIYLDDIMIASNCMEEHMQTLIKVFKRLTKNNLVLRLDKCEFMQSKVKYLGYTITGKGIMADEKGLEAVNNFPIPKKTVEVQSFLGLCSYFRRFVRDFSLIAKPLYDLTRKDVKFEFGETQLECFQLLKNKLLSSPVLALYDHACETELHCDASSVGFGAILLQKKNDNTFHPVFYFSKRTTETEAKYHSFELETLAIVYALRRFRIYLQGKSFKIVTDCNSLTLTLNKKDLNPRIARWALELQNYNYVLEHRSNRQMQHVDALSRCTNILVLETNTFEENLIVCQSSDPKLKSIKSELEKCESKKYEMRNGIVYRKTDGDQILFYVPNDMESQVIYKYHDDMGHLGVDKVVDSILKNYWFPNLRVKVLTHIKNCLKCIVFSSKHGRDEGFLHIIPKGNSPFEMIHIDHFGPIDDSVKIKKHILVVVDAYTKFTRLYPTKTTSTKEVIVSLSDYFRAYSRPRCIVSDRGSCFTSHDFGNFLEENSVKHIKVATASPQANGQVERINRCLKPMLAKMVDFENGIKWPNVVETVEFSLNNTLHRAVGQHPSVMLFGKNQRGPVTDALKERLNDINNEDTKVNLARVRERAEEKQKRLQDYNKKYVDKRRQKPTLYKTGDYVLIKNFDTHAVGAKKLIPKFKGPYKVSKVLRNDRYLLKDADNFQKNQVPYVGVWAVGNIRPWLNKKKKTKCKKRTIRMFV